MNIRSYRTMEKTFLVLLMLFVSTLYSPPGALGLDVDDVVNTGEAEENATEVGGITEVEKVIPMTKLEPSFPQNQSPEEAEKAESVEEPVYESTFITTTVEEHPEATDVVSEQSEVPQPEPETVNLTPHSSTAPPPEVTGADQGHSQTPTSSKEELELEGDPSRSGEVDGEEDSCDQDASLEGMRRLSESMMAFSVDLFKLVDQDSKEPNIVLSPLSISLGLSQLALGAGSETEKKLLRTLNVESAKCLHRTLKTVRKELGSRLLRLATRMYIGKGFQVKEGFQKRSNYFYGAKPVTLGLNSEDNLNMINGWVKEVTEGQIPNFLSQVPEDLVLLLLNAMHFKGFWINKFDPNQTSEERFYLSDQLMVPVQMMRASKYPLSYFEWDHADAQVARLPFKGNMSLIVILPNSFDLQISKFLDEFNQTELYSLFGRETPTLLKVPRLLLDFKLELTQALTRLGLGELFSSPDLHGISEEPLAVSSIQHQSTLQLNEEGVEASAATSIQISRSYTSFSVNRPFIFFVMDDLTRMPLFLGKVGNPNPSAPVLNRTQNDSPDTKFVMKGYDPK
ncbi:alpha-2-antiplasmin isoform X1 [Lissotriton helveticus]